jgi:hypothetical protein
MMAAPAKKILLGTLLAVAASFAVSGLSQAGAAENLLKIPKGYQAGRSDAKYGSYESVLSDEARDLQTRLINLENRIMGLSKLANEDQVQQSESIFLLEYATLRLNLDVANAPGITDFDRESMLYQTTRMYSAVRVHGERLFEDMVRFIDVMLPGPNGGQFRDSARTSAASTYLPNYRIDTLMSEPDRAEAYKKKVEEFKGKGGSLTEIKLFTPELIKTFKDYTRMEYVVRENGDVYVTEGSAGHILLAEGKAVKAAGQLILMRDLKGAFTLAVVSNSSGSFKPDISSAHKLGTRLATLLKIPATQVVVTKGEPLSTQAVKVFSKGLNVAKEEVKARTNRLDTVEALLKSPFSKIKAERSCRSVFASAT